MTFVCLSTYFVDSFTQLIFIKSYFVPDPLALAVKNNHSVPPKNSSGKRLTRTKANLKLVRGSMATTWLFNQDQI